MKLLKTSSADFPFFRNTVTFVLCFFIINELYLSKWISTVAIQSIIYKSLLFTNTQTVYGFTYSAADIYVKIVNVIEIILEEGTLSLSTPAYFKIKWEKRETRKVEWARSKTLREWERKRFLCTSSFVRCDDVWMYLQDFFLSLNICFKYLFYFLICCYTYEIIGLLVW